MTMKLYQPVLFVGLGGTGCDIGAELERRMREEICGADGNDFRRLNGKGTMLAYQLPSCVQFVYADMNRAELQRLPRRVVPGPEHVPAVAATAHYVTGLVPDVVSYPELSMRLRLQDEDVVESWLPPRSDDEPKVNPLFKGAGQFPTIGRAALFGSFRDDGGLAPVVKDLRASIGKLATAGEDLHALGGELLKGVDVFVAFSVAGGTGSGIFYDYLHLIEHTLRTGTSLQVKIYPLVLMPSAFPERLGGGKSAELNAGRAMLDLFRLVDQQNGADAQHELLGSSDPDAQRQDEVAVSYPRHQRFVMTPGTMQTGFLFSQPTGATREDMHRSIVSLVASLVGTEMSEDDNRTGEHHQSFADSFVNGAAERQVMARNGIGNRGVSTALVASMTVPVDELAGIVAARLLREAVESLRTSNPATDTNRAEIEEFVRRAGVHPVLARLGVDPGDPHPATGARQVAAALNSRRESMRIGIDALRTKLGREMPDLVERFDAAGTVRSMLTKLDAFRLEAVVSGNQQLRDAGDRGGVAGLLYSRRAAPPAPAGQGPMPPAIPELKDKLVRKVQWGDDVVVSARNQQNVWYQWQTWVVWANVWDSYHLRWSRPLEQVQRELAALTRALTEFAHQDEEDFPRRSAELYRKRVGVSYLLPAGAGHMDQFYTQVFDGVKERKVNEGTLKPNSDAAGVLQSLIGAQTWSDVYELSVSQSPETAVSHLREQVKMGIKTFLRATQPGQASMLPKLHDLLAEASGYGRGMASGPAIPQEYMDEFKGKLAGLMPANFTPEGDGPLKLLINYPANAKSELIEGYLRRAVNLPAEAGVAEDLRPTATESLSVVLFRTGMGVTEVDEVRHVLLTWAAAVAHPEPTDLLLWRQRTGYDFGYLATREDHRVRILHRLLNALWNGRATVVGPPESPDRVKVTLNGGVTMSLPLTRLPRVSSWGSLVRAYELWALDDNDIHRRFCEQLMKELPADLDGSPPMPDELFQVLRRIAPEQVKVLTELMQQQQPEQRFRSTQMLSFWESTCPSALELKFTNKHNAVASSLSELEKVVERGDAQ